MPRPYEGQAAALATIHGKARAIGPAFRRRLGLALVVPEGIDTDRLGTFTGEVPRPAGLKETAVLKARVGLAATGLPLSVASEGSFGPHPVIPFLAAAREALAFVDIARGLTLVEERVSERTNFAALDLTTGADIPGFLARARFPSHGLILRSGGQIIKGITEMSPVNANANSNRPLDPAELDALGLLAGGANVDKAGGRAVRPAVPSAPVR